MQWRWQHEIAPGDPWTNMAHDAALLAAMLVEKEVLPTIRLYQWDRPSVSFGRLQNETAVQRSYPDLPCVRRPTGGRAVLHGNDLTITVATRSAWLPNKAGEGTLASYRLIMAGLREALNQSGIPTAFGSARENHQTTHVVNCFDIVASCDLTDSRDGRKIAGSAQRRQQGAILQQTTMPLELLTELEGFVNILQSSFQRALQVQEWVVN